MSTESAGQSINSWNADYMEALYAQWRQDPTSVDAQWQPFFHGFDLGLQHASDEPMPGGSARPAAVAHTKQGCVDSLIYHYRDIGHLASDLDPLGTVRPWPEDLELSSFDLTDADLDETFDPGRLPLHAPAPLREIIRSLHDTYCRHIGVEYMHIQDREQRRWLQEKMEPARNAPPF
ncbi:MAG: 2-oxoglutarate dehydrogenase E1 component, partial [Planctomycetota bacterium]